MSSKKERAKVKDFHLLFLQFESSMQFLFLAPLVFLNFALFLRNFCLIHQGFLVLLVISFALLLRNFYLVC